MSWTLSKHECWLSPKKTKGKKMINVTCYTSVKQDVTCYASSKHDVTTCNVSVTKEESQGFLFTVKKCTATKC